MSTPQVSNYYLGDGGAFLYPLVRDYLGWRNSMVDTLQQCLKEQPENLMALIIDLGSSLHRTDLALNHETYTKKMQNIMTIFEKQTTGQDNSRMLQLHIQALQAWMNGQYRYATEIWEDLLKMDTFDAIALKFAYDGYFYLGDSENICKSVERHVENYNDERCVPMEIYGYILGMYAFGLEETYQYKEAEQAAIKAIAINKDDAWAMHAWVHVREMEGDVSHGIEFMKTEESVWSTCAALSCHMYWHWCLFLWDQGKFDEVLKIYDEKISVHMESLAPLDLVDASSLLYRLYLDGIIDKKDSRWKKVRQCWSTMLCSHTFAFNDAHILMVYNDRSDENVSKMLDEQWQSLENYLLSSSNQVENGSNETKVIENDSKKVYQQVGIATCKAIDLYNYDHFTESAKLLQLLVPTGKLKMIGGSHAQRDVFELIFIHAVFECCSMVPPQGSDQWDVVKKLLEMRKSRKPNSGKVKRLYDKFYQLSNLNFHTNSL
ncbi:hypothetical protein C9374_013576 [Naegleria lovaniensis]|uniref:Tetratricopeptide repeat protein 38 n=1 Tax=Naegleria lovaniensis TaxID=51637 RepID=A0AA88KQ33_NAELO|nr:uncharacterized protein C9374_013576 [Naegleria lovaniensis]KAG2392091.1 hypothetical protein C9374_013576 [Naegleria lovaniensis]